MGRRNRITGRWIVFEASSVDTVRALSRTPVPPTKYLRNGQHPIDAEIAAKTAEYMRVVREHRELVARLLGLRNPTKVAAGARSGAARRAGRDRIEAAIAAEWTAGTADAALARRVADACGCTTRRVRQVIAEMNSPRSAARGRK